MNWKQLLNVFKLFGFFLWVFKISVQTVLSGKKPLFYPDEAISFSYSPKEEKTKELKSSLWLPKDLSGGPFPLVLFSHGYLGFGLQWTEFCRKLADKGYIVVAPDHADHLASSTPQTNKLDFKNWKKENNLLQVLNINKYFADRPKDIKALISKFLELNQDPSSKFFQRINPAAIGAIGHSLGSWTVEMLVASSDKETREERLKAALLFTPPEWKESFSQEEINSVTTPKFFIFGEKDSLFSPKETIPRTFDVTPDPKYLASVKGMDHHSFTDFYPKHPQSEETMKYSFAFLDAYLKDDKNAKEVLKQTSPWFLTYKANP